MRQLKKKGKHKGFRAERTTINISKEFIEILSLMGFVNAFQKIERLGN